MAQYKITHLSIKNFKMIREMNFSFSNPDLIVLDGPNGFGKTTFFDVIEIILKGKPRRITEAEHLSAKTAYEDSPIHRDDSKGIELELILKNDSEEKVVINRSFPAAGNDKSQNKNVQQVYRNNELKIIKNGKILGTTVEEVLGLKDLKLMNVLNYVEQDENTFFLKRKPEERYTALGGILGVEEELSELDQLKKTGSAIGKKIRGLEDELKAVEVIDENVMGYESPTFSRLLSEASKPWDLEELNITNSEIKNSYLEELKDVEDLIANRDRIKDVQKIIFIRQEIEDTTFLESLIDNYWHCHKIKHFKQETESRKKWEAEIKLYSSLKVQLDLKDYEKLSEAPILGIAEIFLEDIDFQDYKRLLDIIVVLKENLSDQNEVLEELKSRRDAFHNYTLEHGASLAMKQNECPSCGEIWSSANELMDQLKATEDKIFSSYKQSNKILEESKKSWEKLYVGTILNGIKQKTEDLNELLELLISPSEFSQLLKIRETFKIRLKEWNNNISSHSLQQIKSLINGEIVEDRNEVLSQMRQILKEDVPEHSNEENISSLFRSFKIYFNSSRDALFKLSFIAIETKRKYIEFSYSQGLRKITKDLEGKMRALRALKDKVKEIEDILKEEIDGFILSVVRNITLPFYIYSGKILQNHFLGSGLAFEVDLKSTSPKVYIRPAGINHEVNHILSSGQLASTVIALTLALNKVYSSSRLGSILIDDPLQTLDEINMHSLVEVLKHNFSEQQIILSTHENRYANFIMYKFRKYNLKAEKVNMKNEFIQMYSGDD